MGKAEGDWSVPGRRPRAVVLVTAIVAILVWHRPWTQSAPRREAGRIAAELHQPVAVVTGKRFSPEWLRVRSGGCVRVVNHSSVEYRTKFGVVPARGAGDL